MRLLVVIVLACLGCKGKQAAPAASGPITEAEATAFAQKLATAATPCTETVIEPLLADATIAHPLCAWIAGSSSYSLLRVRTLEGEARPIMRRMRTEADGVSVRVAYDQLRLVRKDKEVVLRDAYAYRQGKLLSELVAGKPPHPDVEKARELSAAGKQDEAMAVVEKLPIAMRRELMLRAYVTARDLPVEQARLALDELAKAFPGDPSVALTLVDGAFQLEDYDAVLRWADVLEKEIGRDALIDSQRAVAHLKKRDLDNALARATAATTLEPGLTFAQQLRLDILIERKQWPEALAVMTELEKNHGVSFEEAKLRAEPKLAELVASPSFAEWLARR